jgi:hypothetical protein
MVEKNRTRLADQGFTAAIINRRVDIIDAGVYHLIDEGDGLVFGQVTRLRGAGQFHRAVAQPACDNIRAPHFPRSAR